MDAHEGKTKKAQNSPLGNFTTEMSDSLVGNQFRNDYRAIWKLLEIFDMK